MMCDDFKITYYKGVAVYTVNKHAEMIVQYNSNPFINKSSTKNLVTLNY
jgi:hypothetical protein